MRPTWVEVDLDAIVTNVRTVVDLVAPSTVCAVVKANAYGHGDVPVAETALGAGATSLAVALVEEGMRLREAGIEAPILLLSEPVPGDVPRVVAHRLTPTVYSPSFVEALAATGAPVDVHVMVDTGMHRVGADSTTALEVARSVEAADHLGLAGVWTHLAVAEEDPDFTSLQLERFTRFLDALALEGIDPGVRHAANTAGALAHPTARFDMVRLGLGMYGMRPAPDTAPGVPLVPAMRVMSQASYVRRHPEGTRPSYGRVRPLERESTVVTVPIGYADGVSRRLSSVGGDVLIGGRRHPFAGTVTMDQIVVDVGDAPVSVGDEVVLLGRQGSEEITADEWAERLGTINYEITCRFGPRVPRRFKGAGGGAVRGRSSVGGEPDTAETRSSKPGDGSEREILLGWLGFHRDALAVKCAGLDGRRLVTASTPPSPLTLLGLVRHMTEMERVYGSWAMVGGELDLVYGPYEDGAPAGDFDDLDATMVQASMQAWQRERAAADRAIGAASLDEIGSGNGRTLRWNVVKLLQEYARHNGHADLIREAIDGVTGE